MIHGYGQYKDDFFNKLNVPLVPGRSVLDIGCGDGTDGEVFVNEYRLKYYGFDIYEHENIKKLKLRFRRGSVFKVPYVKKTFDYVFSHDVLHHVDEPKQRQSRHRLALKNMRNACKEGGIIIVVEANRYNPLFYPHMVKLRKHEHFVQSYFIREIKDVFSSDIVHFQFFEAHLYPSYLLPLFRLYEVLMEHMFLERFLAYNVAVIQRKK